MFEDFNVDETAMKVPRHAAIIMDGNGRWAEAQGLPRADGHAVGAESVRQVARACRSLGVEALTLYSFSTENWSRPADEVGALMTLLHRYVVHERAELLDNQIRFRAMGQLDRLPAFVREPLLELMAATDTPDARMDMVLALSYGSRLELTDAVRDIARRVRTGELDPDDIVEETVSGALYCPDLPDPDLLIRTSGELRISNFLLWQLAYAEIYVTDTAWPDFRRPQLEQAFRAYAARERRYGQTSAQLAGDGSC
jgi:undecaprenyl diphosphate synthase